jgi:hypothetical protein
MTIERPKGTRFEAVSDVKERLQARVSELDIEVHEDAFNDWRKREKPAKGK